MIEQTRFLTTVFLSSEFKTFAVVFICGNLFLRRWKNCKNRKIRTRKNVVPHSSYDTIQKRREITSKAGFAHGY